MSEFHLPFKPDLFQGVQPEGHADCAENIHLFITRGGFPEERMTRGEFRALVETLYCDCYRLTQVQPDGALTIEVPAPTQKHSL